MTPRPLVLGFARENEVLAVYGGAVDVWALAGNDTIWMGLGRHVVDAGSGTDFVEAHATFDFDHALQNYPAQLHASVGGWYADAAGTTLLPAGTDGNDTIKGGSGTDTIAYRHAGAITADLGKHSVLVGGTTDTVTGFEKLIGSAFADKITGSNNAETLDGFSGNDIIRGKGGADTLKGGAGADKFVFLKSDVGAGLGVDHITDFGTGRDRIDVRDFFTDHAGAKMGDILHLTDTAAGLKISALSGGAFVDVAVLDGVHQLSLAALGKDFIIA